MPSQCVYVYWYERFDITPDQSLEASLPVNRNEDRSMNKKQKDVYWPPMLVKHGILRDLTAQFGELFQDGRRLTDLSENEKHSANLRLNERPNSRNSM